MIPDNVLTIDFETTDVDPKTCHPVEVAVYHPNLYYVKLIKPPVPIPVETSAIHHIVDYDVELANDWETEKGFLRELLNGVPDPILAAHNAKYEIAVLGTGFEDVHWICTYKCSLRIWPDAPNHKNETLRYFLGLPNLGRGHDHSAHSANHDATVTYGILGKLLEHATLQELLDWSAEPALLPKIPFGKHRGKKWSDPTVDYGYFKWVLAQQDMDEDIKWNTRRECDRRFGNAAK